MGPFDPLVGYRSTQYQNIAAATVLLYDYCITFKDERRHFWKSRWTWSRIAFTANRYIAPIISLFNLAASLQTDLNNSFCAVYTVYLVTVSGPVQLILVEIVLTLRLYALYGKSKRILACLIAILLVTTLSSSVVVSLEFGSNHAVAITTPGSPICFAKTKDGKPRSFLWAYWIPIAIFEIIAFCLALAKTRQHHRDSQPLTQLGVDFSRQHGGKSLGQQLVDALFRDSLFYFALMSLLVFIGAFIDTFGTATFGVPTLVSTPIQSLLSIMGSRLLLSTHDVVTTVFHPQSDDTHILESMFTSHSNKNYHHHDNNTIALTELHTVNLHLDSLNTIGPTSPISP